VVVFSYTVEKGGGVGTRDSPTPSSAKLTNLCKMGPGRLPGGAVVA
jgi:hypothetical protein